MPHLVEKIKGFLMRAKTFGNTTTYQKLGGGIPLNFPRPPCTTVRV